jgi:hypothetical protein
MQSLFDTLHASDGGKLGLTVGLLLLAALLIQVVVEAGRGLLRFFSDRAQQRVVLEKLRLQVQETRLRCQEVEQTRLVWNGYRKFSVAKGPRMRGRLRILLEAARRQAAAAVQARQYLTFSSTFPGATNRWSAAIPFRTVAPHGLLPHHHQKEKRRRTGPHLPPGARISFFCDAVKDDILNVKAPTGHFFLDMTKNNPIAYRWWCGVTPMLSMANAIAARDRNVKRGFLRCSQRRNTFTKPNWKSSPPSMRTSICTFVTAGPDRAKSKAVIINMKGGQHRTIEGTAAVKQFRILPLRQRRP